MGVQFIGHEPEQRESILSPLAKEASKYTEFLRESRHESGELEKNRQFQGAENEKNRQSALQSEMLKYGLDTKQKNLKYAQDTIQNLSNMDAKDRDLFLQSDAGKEYTKWLKTVDKDFIDEAGSLKLLPPNKPSPEKAKELELSVYKLKRMFDQDQPWDSMQLQAASKIIDDLSYNKVIDKEEKRQFLSILAKKLSESMIDKENANTSGQLGVVNPGLSVLSDGLSQPNNSGTDNDPLGIR